MRPNYFDFARYSWRGTYPPPGECSACRALVELAKAGAGVVSLWARRLRERRDLARLDRRMQRDIGVTPSEVAREIGKPFWRA